MSWSIRRKLGGTPVSTTAPAEGISRHEHLLPTSRLEAFSDGVFAIAGLSYFLGAEIAKRIGNAGAKAVLGVIVIVAIGLAIRAGVARWRAARRAQPAEAAVPDRLAS